MMHVLSLDSVSRLSKPYKWVVLVWVGLCLMGIAYFCCIKPKMDDYRVLKKQEMVLRGEFELKQTQASTLEAHRNQLQTLQRDLNRMLKQLPAVSEVSGLRDDISKLVVAHGLVIELMTPSPATKHQRFIELPLKMIVVGHYQQFLVFLTRLTDMERLVSLQALVIERASDREENTNIDGRLTIKMTIKLYSYKLS